MPTNTARLIVAKIELYAADPAALANNVKALKGSEAIRLRIGDWRVLVLDGVVLEVARITSRGSAYEE
ncbi:type II toxin-antitoxin system RelE/ParE family toxin [Zavarzinia sp.]|uniref:type II toxin-antitoxin system RelE family toxin n=1 Tax=Zavarzinia sp. TaxID=2027920 RepID=UPI003567A4A0